MSLVTSQAKMLVFKKKKLKAAVVKDMTQSFRDLSDPWRTAELGYREKNIEARYTSCRREQEMILDRTSKI